MAGSPQSEEEHDDDRHHDDEEALIEAWLAGELPPDQAAELEGRLGEFDSSEDNTDFSGLGDAMRLRREASEAVADSSGGITRMQSIPHPDSSGKNVHGLLADERSGDHIGHYRLIEKVGHGGFGDVWKAEQTGAIKRPVALKVIKRGMDTDEVIRRFEAERQALAIMDHPSIATVFDAGTTATGRPFFAMELVDGIPVDAFCRRHELDLTQRLELFRSICGAVQHAHQKGVIHRDIKPSNVLVSGDATAPVAKVIDFGLAKAMHQPLTEQTMQTRMDQVLGTPAYMSPEQAAAMGADVDTRADIYSLGVLLYEMLTGTPPFDPKALMASGIEEMIRTIREVEPPVPSRVVSTLNGKREALPTMAADGGRDLDRALRKELDWVVMRAMEKDPDRRYQTVEQFAHDIACYLNGETLSVLAPTPGYRLAKFCRRHRAAVATAAALVALLVIGTVVSLWQAWRAERNAERARQNEERAIAEAEKAWRMVQMVKVMFDSADLNQHATANYTVRQMLDDFSRGGMWEKLEGDPAVEAELRNTVASCYESLGRYEEALEHALRGLELRRMVVTEDGEQTLKLADDLSNVGHLYLALGKVERAAELLQECAEIEARAGSPRSGLTMTALGKIAISEGDFVRGEQLTRQAVLKLEVEPEWNSSSDGLHTLIDARSTMALALMKQEKFPESIELYRECTATAVEEFGVHPVTAGATHNLATALRLSGNAAEAERKFRRALALRLQYLDQGASKVAMTMHSLAQAIEDADTDRLQEAESLHRRALSDRKAEVGEAHPDICRGYYWLADNLEKQKREQEAADYRERAESLARELMGQ